MNSSDDELIKIIKILGQRVGQIKTERGTLRQRQDSDNPGDNDNVRSWQDHKRE